MPDAEVAVRENGAATGCGQLHVSIAAHRPTQGRPIRRPARSAPESSTVLEPQPAQSRRQLRHSRHSVRAYAFRTRQPRRHPGPVQSATGRLALRHRQRSRRNGLLQSPDRSMDSRHLAGRRFGTVATRPHPASANRAPVHRDAADDGGPVNAGTRPPRRRKAPDKSSIATHVGCHGRTWVAAATRHPCHRLACLAPCTVSTNRGEVHIDDRSWLRGLRLRHGGLPDDLATVVTKAQLGRSRFVNSQDHVVAPLGTIQ